MRLLVLVLMVQFYSQTILAQDNIKKIIYKDLFLINDLYKGVIIQNKQTVLRIQENGDTTLSTKLLNNITDEYDRVKIVEIDSLSSFYFVKAKIMLTPNGSFNSLFDSVFKFVLYKQDNIFYKVDGFIISEIEIINGFPIYIICNYLDLGYFNSKKLKKYIIYRKTDKIKNYLSVSILEKISLLGYEINSKPYVLDLLNYLY